MDYNWSDNMISEDIAYAGLFDGEGSIYLQKDQKKKKHKGKVIGFYSQRISRNHHDDECFVGCMKY